MWWRWYYWGCPVAWTIYGLLVSQFGDIDEMLQGSEPQETVKQFLRRYLGMKRDFLAVVAVVNVGFAVGFALIFEVSLVVRSVS